MKHHILSILTLCFLAPNITAGQSTDLNGIQQKIQGKLVESFRGNSNQILPVISELEAGGAESANPLHNYWLAYAHYQSAIYFLQARESDQSNAAIKDAMAILEKQASTTDEDLVLLGSLLSLSINFSPDAAPILSAKAGQQFQAALKQNPDNLRAHLGIGRSDYYRPKEYGGGKLVEKHLQKALAMEEQADPEGAEPTWGKDEAHYYLASYYRREGRLAEAKLYCKKGLKAYPGHALLTSLMTKLEQ